MDFETLLGDIFPPTSEEFKIIKESYDTITTGTPTTSGEAKTNMILLDRYKAQLATIYYLLNHNISKKKKVYQATYDAQYTRLVKLGRPSNTAIQAEIRVSNPEYAGLSAEVEKLEQVKDLVNTYLKCIDNCKQTAIECLRDIRRID